MNVYVWEISEGLTESYHSGGHVLAVADTVEHARGLIRDASTCSDPDELDTLFRQLDGETEAVFPTDDGEPERVMIFPDEGCC